MTEPAFPKPVKREKAAPKGIKRKTPLRAVKDWEKPRTTLKAKRWGIAPNPAETKRRRARSGREDLPYLAAVRTLPCCACAEGKSWGGGRIDPHHPRNDGKNVKCHDREVIPLCRLHHGAVEELHSAFKGWNKSRRREWYLAKIIETQAKVAAKFPHLAPTTPVREGFPLPDQGAVA